MKKNLLYTRYHQLITLFLLSVVIFSCNNSGKKEIPARNGSPLFTLLSPEKTHVDFSNTLTEGLNTNVLLYEYFYNGGGVAVGDVNGDGLEDIYFSGNMVSNRLYLNEGKMSFKDITAAAQVEGRPGPWKTGTLMADVNGDGKLDIYVCYSGKVHAPKRANQLFINEGNDSNGIPRFSEQAEQYGLADSAYSTHAVFFDFDRDGDLDMFLLNHNPNSLPVLDEANTALILKTENPLTGVRLFRNDNMHFNDITAQAGISSTSLTYGLGAGVSDINGDGWPDIYISNDYTIPDYLYINNRNGTFTDKMQSSFGHITQFSMGNNISDINNDGRPDIFTLDMLPEDNRRQKLLFAPDNYGKFDLTVRSGFYYQYMRNMLQLNNGNGTFSEIGQLSGISNTDWSWAPLFADFDNDGWKDLFITNGYLRDYTNMDFIKYMNDYTQAKGRLKREDVMEIVQKMPSSNVPNYMFRNDGNLCFTNTGQSWGTNATANSNGAAYADLDNDGDLDLVINNIDKPAFIYENTQEKAGKHHFLEIKTKGINKNTQGIGAKLVLYVGQKIQMLEQMPSRGYQSSISPVLHFGLGSDSSVDSLKIIWQSGREQTIHNVKAGQILTLNESEATETFRLGQPPSPLFTEVAAPFDHSDAIKNINDYKRQPLLINPLSFSGPCMTSGDVNGDGLADVFVGGSKGQAGTIYIRQKSGRYITKPQPALEQDKQSEDADAVFVDANADGHPDLYVCSGGYDNFQPADNLLEDRLYLNDGKGNFSRDKEALPSLRVSKSCVRAADINGDGYVDLFVGSRVIPGQYPEVPPSFLLINNGKGHFTDRIQELAPALQKMGMVTDAAWTDMNGDKKPDLIVAGEWMPISVFINSNGKLENKTANYFDKAYSGWWNKLLVGDFNKDGKPDILAGNLGLNSQCKVSDSQPADMYYRDFDGNGTIDPVLCFYIQGKSYPFIVRDELTEQLSGMKKKFTDYKSYADAGLSDIFSDEELKAATHVQANYLATACFESAPDGKLKLDSLPLEVQMSPVCSMLALDYDHDGNDDLLLAGNINNARLRLGKSDANYGILLHSDGKGNFEYVPQLQSGFAVKGDVRSMLKIDNEILFGINQQKVKAYRLTVR